MIPEGHLAAWQAWKPLLLITGADTIEKFEG